MKIQFETLDLRMRKVGNLVMIEARGPNSEWAEVETHMPKVGDEVFDLVDYVRELIADPDEVKKLGDQLGQFLMPPPIRQLYTTILQNTLSQSNKGLRIQLSFSDNAREFAHYPWEALRIDGRTIVMDPKQAIVRTVNFAEPAISLVVEKPPYRILAISASPSDMHDIQSERENEQINSSLTPLIDEGLLEIDIHHGITYEKFEEIIRNNDFHILHFSGHSGISKEGYGKLYFQDSDGKADLVDSSRFGDVLFRSNIRMVFLSGSETAYGRDQGLGVAEALLKLGIPIVIAYTYEVPVSTAIRFTETFYREFAQGSYLEQAVFSSRRAVASAVDGGLYWLLPLLFMRTREGKFWAGEAGYRVETFISEGKLITQAIEQGSFNPEDFANRLDVAISNLELIKSREKQLRAQQLVAEVQDAITYSDPEITTKKLSDASTFIHLSIEETERKQRFVVLSMSMVLLSLVAVLAYLLRDVWTPQMTIPVVSLPLSVVVWSFVGGVAAMLQTFVGSKKNPSGQPLNYEWLLWRPVIGIILGSVLYLTIAAGMLVLGQQDFNSLASTQNPYVLWVIAFLGGFSDKFAILVFDNIVRSFSRENGNVNEEQK